MKLLVEKYHELSKKYIKLTNAHTSLKNIMLHEKEREIKTFNFFNWEIKICRRRTWWDYE